MSDDRARRSSNPQTASAASDLAYAPPAFTNSAGERIVFVDFIEAEYVMEFDASNRVAQAHSTVSFMSDEEGHPAFSLRQAVLSAELDGATVRIRDEEAPDRQALFKSVSKSVPAGAHTLSIVSTVKRPGPTGRNPVLWYKNPERLQCLFDMSDLRTDGGYLEAYLPSNYEYDHFRMTFRVKVLNSTEEHRIFTNGTVKETGSNEWEVRFPDFFTTSCPWFHMGPSHEFVSQQRDFKSCDGRSIPVIIYTTSHLADSGVDLEAFQETAHDVLETLESTFGPFHHPSVTVFATGLGRGGMEYSGATSTRLGSLRHELDHSYFARSVTPCNGDAGWIDEAIASWADAGYPSSPNPPLGTSNMGNRSPYIRTTNMDAYSLGRSFLAHIDHVLSDQEGLKKMLAVYAQEKRHASVRAKEFQSLIEGFHGASLADLFNTYVYEGSPLRAFAAAEAHEMANPHHVTAGELFEGVFPPGHLDD
jgi:hypothetical protein